MIQRLPAFLGEPRRPLRAILLSWPLVTGGALLLSALAAHLLPGLERPDFGHLTGAQAILLLVFFAPFVETLIMAGVLELLVRLLPERWAPFASAMLWGVAHSFLAAAWGLVIWWVFLILSTLYVTWRTTDRAWAIGIPFLVHALNNGVPVAMMAAT